MKKRVFLSVAAITAAVLLALIGLWLWFPFQKNAKFEDQENAKIDECASCLQEGLSLSSEFSEAGGKDGPRNTDFRNDIITVRQKLIKLKAYCKDGVLYDDGGKEIRFVRAPEHGKAPPEKIWVAEQQSIRELRKRYRVVLMYHKQIQD